MSLNDSRSLSRLVLKESRLSASVRSLGNMFQSRDPLQQMSSDKLTRRGIEGL